jgi:hypothetical protein
VRFFNLVVAGQRLCALYGDFMSPEWWLGEDAVIFSYTYAVKQAGQSAQSLKPDCKKMADTPAAGAA